ncbi:MAG: hypothetical protein P8X73_17130 [Ignavibacteriaceae bacterium]
MKFLRKLYDWVLHWAETPYGPAALFVLAFAEASFFPIPPDALLIALVLGVTQKAFKFATICLVGSVTGALLGYAIGHFLWFLTTYPAFQRKILMLFKNYTRNMISGSCLLPDLLHCHIKLLQYLRAHSKSVSQCFLLHQ